MAFFTLGSVTQHALPVKLSGFLALVLEGLTRYHVKNIIGDLGVELAL